MTSAKERAVEAGARAYDEERCRLNGEWHSSRCQPMSAANRASIFPMIAAAVEAAQAVLMGDVIKQLQDYDHSHILLDDEGLSWDDTRRWLIDQGWDIADMSYLRWEAFAKQSILDKIRGLPTRARIQQMAEAL